MKAGLEEGDWADAAEVITQLWRELQDSHVPALDYTLLAGYADNSAVESSIRKYLALTLVEKSLADQNVSKALADLATYRLSLTEHSVELLANIGIIHLHFQNDLAAAENVLAQLRALAAQNDATAAELEKVLAMMIENHRRLFGITSTPKPPASAPAAVRESETSLRVENYPNPFNPETTIRFHLNERQKVRLVIFDLTGQRVRTLVEGELPSGEQTIPWDGRNQYDRLAASGIYFYELVLGNKVERRKMMLIR